MRRRGRGTSGVGARLRRAWPAARPKVGTGTRRRACSRRRPRGRRPARVRDSPARRGRSPAAAGSATAGRCSASRSASSRRFSSSRPTGRQPVAAVREGRGVGETPIGWPRGRLLGNLASSSAASGPATASATFSPGQVPALRGRQHGGHGGLRQGQVGTLACAGGTRGACISSATTRTPYRSASCATATSSSAVCTVPVGLCGLHRNAAGRRPLGGAERRLQPRQVEAVVARAGPRPRAGTGFAGTRRRAGRRAGYHDRVTVAGTRRSTSTTPTITSGTTAVAPTSTCHPQRSRRSPPAHRARSAPCAYPCRRGRPRHAPPAPTAGASGTSISAPQRSTSAGWCRHLVLVRRRRSSSVQRAAGRSPRQGYRVVRSRRTACLAPPRPGRSRRTRAPRARVTSWEADDGPAGDLAGEDGGQGGVELVEGDLAAMPSVSLSGRGSVARLPDLTAQRGGQATLSMPSRRRRAG